jgi:hypothetical protein
MYFSDDSRQGLSDTVWTCLTQYVQLAVTFKNQINERHLLQHVLCQGVNEEADSVTVALWPHTVQEPKEESASHHRAALER